MEQDDFFSFKDIIKNKTQGKKMPAYEWQNLALQVIKELRIPNFKRNSVFKACKDHPKEIILRALNDTKELCNIGEKWKYFFKVLSDKNKNLKK